MSGKYCTPAEAAKRLGCTQECVRSWLREGYLGHKVLGRWLVDAEELALVESGLAPRRVKTP